MKHSPVPILSNVPLSHVSAIATFPLADKFVKFILNPPSISRLPSIYTLSLNLDIKFTSKRSSFSATLPTATPFPPFLTSIGNDCVEIGKVFDSVVLAVGALEAS